jgi:nitrous oxide reductase accessory protein NosL
MQTKIVKNGIRFQVVLLFVVLAGLLLPGTILSLVQAGEGEIEHPMMNPAHYTDKGICSNCGMMLNMWARTRHAFSNSEGEFETCSLHCLADMSMRIDEQPRNVKSALFTAPEKMVPAADAVYVVGSSAPGTMTMKSKLVFASEKEARDFVAAKGGTVSDFSAAYEMAFKELAMSRPAIDARRKKTGKIKEPAETEGCTVCGMYPYRYPTYRSQILTMDKKTLHFCSTRCLVYYLANPAQYLDSPPKEMFTWVTVYPEGIYEYAGGLFYVVGSGVHGPMGFEALPFRTRAEAGAFAAKEGGKVMRFEEITPDMLQGGHGHGMKMKR